jgi:hypothetical protein
MTPTHVVIIPYFSDQEVARYLRIAEHIRSLGPQQTRYEFLLASSPLIEPNQQLLDAFSQIAPATAFACPTRVFGYPIGPTVMFWDCMDYLAAKMPDDGGFGLWMESDMLPVKPDWLDRLAGEWNEAAHALALGRLVPTVYKWRIPRRKIWIPQHINGGGCYAKSLVLEVPFSYRRDTFDLALFPFLRERGRFQATESFAFSTVQRCHRDMADPRRAVLHGFLQDKDRFIEHCLQVSGRSTQAVGAWPPALAALSRVWRRLKLHLFCSRQQAMLEALLLEQETPLSDADQTTGDAQDAPPSRRHAA